MVSSAFHHKGTKDTKVSLRRNGSSVPDNIKFGGGGSAHGGAP